MNAIAHTLSEEADAMEASLGRFKRYRSIIPRAGDVVLDAEMVHALLDAYESVAGKFIALARAVIARGSS